MSPNSTYDSQSSILPPLAQAGPRRPPDLHRSLAQLSFTRRRLAHVSLLPALLFAGLLWASDALLRLWAEAVNWGLALLDLNGVVAANPLTWANLRDNRLLVADIPAAPPSADQLLIGGLVAAALWLVSMIIRAERTPLRYLLRAFLLCELAALVFWGLLGGVLPYTLGDYIAPGMVLVWFFMLLVPWLHAASFNIFGFGLWRKAALTLLTLAVMALMVPLQYVFQIAVIQPYSLMHLPLLYLFGGVLLEVLVFVSLYAWAMSWQAPERTR